MVNASAICPPMVGVDWLCIDIETTAGRPESAEEYMRRQWSPDSRWTPDTIGRRYREAYAKKLEKLALLDAAGIAVVALNSPRGICVFHSLGKDKAKPEPQEFHLVACDNEKEMLTLLRLTLDQLVGEDTLLVGHNVKSFDLPRLRMAFLRNGLQLPAALGPDQTVCDTMREFCRAFSIERSEMVALSEVLEKFGLPNHKEIVDGSQVDQLIASGQVATLLRYAALDVTQEAEVFLRMTGRSAQLS